VQFTWDPKKAARNERDHAGVTFEEATTVFADPNHLVQEDSDNAQGELRMNVIGFSAKARLLFIVVFEVEVTEAGEELIRIVSARRTTTREENDYASENQS
jgi:uncharacterized protein